MQPHLCQLALASKHPEICREFYIQLLGYLDSGKQAIRGMAASRIFECEQVKATCDWLSGDDPFFQLEIFNFQQPASHSNSSNPLICGYNILFIEAPNISHLLDNKFLFTHLSEVCRYSHGNYHHLLARDIDNNIVDIFSPINNQPIEKPVLRGIGATVKSLEEEIRNFTVGFGLKECKAPSSFDPLFERFKDMRSPNTQKHTSRTIDCGPYKIQLTEFRPGVNAPPKRLVDQGILNIALGIRDHTAFNPLFARLVETGFSPSIRPVGDRSSNTAYLKSQSLSVELLQIPEDKQVDWGFPDLNSTS